jgi:hypothetical protein
MTTMTEQIVVDVDPVTAFRIFTDEFDQWWGRGPIDAYNSARLLERRMEGGVGGRIVEDYGGEELVTGTITIWEPGPDYTWIELRVGNSFLVLWGGGGQTGTDSPFVDVDDLDAHLKHAEAAGARIISPIAERGFRSYSAVDCEGRHWIFAQNGPRIGR